jgi:hypothetical protein
LDGFDNIVRIVRVQFDVKYINISKPFEQDAFAFHDRLSGKGTDVTEPKDGGAIRNDGHKISLGRVQVCIIRIIVDIEARLSDARRIREREIALSLTGL